MSKLLIVIAQLLASVLPVIAQDTTAASTSSTHSVWHGFDRYHFRVMDRPAYLVVPKRIADGKPWVWRARFPDFHFEMDVELLKKGFHVAYVDVAGLFGSPLAMQIGDAFYDDVTIQRGLAARPALEGVSRGGLFVYNWAARHPERVACIYCDTPVLDFRSWPGGKGTGIGSAVAWQQCLAAYGFTEADGLEFQGNPINHAAVIAQHRIPLLHIVSENDVVVPPHENTYVLQQRLQALGHTLPVISVAKGTEQSHGHHFVHPEQKRVVDFIRKHASVNEK
ncbi:MAG: prolyl oligopeptidase family serine peptidase [Planctomycetaceae bacterium]